jgi:formate--tetrahydrofolate ligase
MPVKKRYPVPSDIEIAQKADLRPIIEVAKDAGILEDEIELYGKYIAKMDYKKILDRTKEKSYGKLICVTAITPTPLGEGKTVTAFGLGQGLHLLGKKVINTFREPSKGPTFGIKGGATGGGYSQALPMEQINLHFTGDIHAVETAHNLCGAAIDAHILHGNKLAIDPLTITWPFCEDLNSRSLRNIVVGLGGRGNGYPREASYDITAATETGAILALATDLRDLRERIGRAVVGYTYDGKPVTCENLKVAGAMTALLTEAIKPNLVQSLEGHPMICHGFPFANVAHGNNSTLANILALRLADYVVTENGFGAENGFVKFCDIVARQSDVRPDCAVVVCSIRALKEHGGAFHMRPGRPYSEVKEAAETPDPVSVEKGCENLTKNIEIVKTYGIPVIVAINRFTTDSDEEIEVVRKKAIESGADGVAVSEAWTKGGEGCTDLAKEVLKVLDEKVPKFNFLYPDNLSIKEKIEIIAKKIFGARKVEFSEQAEKKIIQFEKLGYRNLPINVAKTQLSISHDPDLKGVPKDYVLPIIDIKASVGAGFLYPLCGKIFTMPGLSTRPAFMDVDVDLDTGKIKGLF